MVKDELSESEKKLLNALGKSPGISMKGLCACTPYRRLSSVVKKISQLQKRGMIYGPFHDVNVSKLSKNPLNISICVVEFNKNYGAVMSYLTLIESLWVAYPVLSPHKELLNVTIFSSDDGETESLFRLLKDNDIITDYIIRPWSHRREIENPNFFGDPNPSLDNLLKSCDVPDVSSECHDTDWSECDIAVLPYLQMGCENSKLIEILRAERRKNRNWKYHQIKYAYKKMLGKNLIRKMYLLFPFPFDQCIDFNLFFRTRDRNLTQRIVCNLGRGERLTREYVLCGEWGYIGFASHPLFLTGIMDKLNQIEVIEEKELYQLRSAPDRDRLFSQPINLKYFDLDTQTLRYPYRIYREEIKKAMEIGE